MTDDALTVEPERRCRLPRAPRRTSRCCATSASTSRAASRTASSASRAAASRRWRSRSSGTSRATDGCSSGAIAIDGRDVLALTTSELRQLRASDVSMVYQEPGTALNPSIRVGRQVAEVYEIAGATAQARRSSAPRRSSTKVQIADPGGVMQPLPAPALGRHAAARRDRDGARHGAGAADPRRADDRARRDRRGRGARPGRGLRGEFHTSVLFISHNLGVIAKMCDRVGVLYAGELVEEGAALDGAPRSAAPLHGRPAALHPAPRRRRKDHGRLDTIAGFLPEPGYEVAGCVFADRCALVAGSLPHRGSRRCTSSAAAVARAATSTSARRALPRTIRPTTAARRQQAAAAERRATAS